MTIEFGKIKSYNPDRGFGFIHCTFSNPSEKVFFHIKKIKKQYPELAYKLDNREDIGTINLWYDIEVTNKGKQVIQFWLKTENIPQEYEDELNNLIGKVKKIWRSIESQQPSWLDVVTIELLGNDLRNDLSAERSFLINQLKEEEERLKKEALQLLEEEIQRLHQAHDLTEEESRELKQLLSEMRPLKFTHSDQLSKYIKKHQLGYKYPNIAGVVRMKRDNDEWDFNGGFPPRIYRIICTELNLDNKGTNSRAIAFTPYKDIY